MTINDQIAAAWKEYYESFDLPTTRLAIAFHSDVFEAGYLAALKPFILNPGEWIGMDNSDPPQVWVWCGDRDESAEPVRRLLLPSPSDLFAETKFN